MVSKESGKTWMESYRADQFIDPEWQIIEHKKLIRLEAGRIAFVGPERESDRIQNCRLV
jgi:hypothetical protein